MCEREQKANEILKNLNLDSAPIEIIKISESLGITVSDYDFKDENINAALYTKTSGEKVIFVQKDLSNEKKRFAIAHEIGHHILHKWNRDIYYTKDKSKKNEPKEIEADDFAAFLLLPERLVETNFERYKRITELEKYSNIPFSIKQSILIENLAQHFAVTIKTMRYRLNNLGLI